MSSSETNHRNDAPELRVKAPTKVLGISRDNFPSPKAMQYLEDEGRELTTAISPNASTSMQIRTPMASSTDRQSDERSEEASETHHERAQREEDESIALARALMAEEAMAVSYHISMDYLRHNRDQFSEEDLAALQAAMEEDEQPEVEVPEEDEDGGMSYELLLRLGERLGDVKSERWSRIAQENINKLSTFKFDPKAVCDKDDNDCEVKCLVCQFQYESDDKLRRLPCSHCFHAGCVDQWLMSKDFCPYCRTAIVEEDEN